MHILRKSFSFNVFGGPEKTKAMFNDSKRSLSDLVELFELRLLTAKEKHIQTTIVTKHLQPNSVHICSTWFFWIRFIPVIHTIMALRFKLFPYILHAYI